MFCHLVSQSTICVSSTSHHQGYLSGIKSDIDWKHTGIAISSFDHGISFRKTRHTFLVGHQQCCQIINIWLVVSTPLKNMKVNWDDYCIPNIWKNIKCSKPPTRYVYPANLEYTQFQWIIISLPSVKTMVLWMFFAPCSDTPTCSTLW